MKPRRRGTEAQRREDTLHRQPLKKTEIPRFNEVEKFLLSWRHQYLLLIFLSLPDRHSVRRPTCKFLFFHSLNAFWFAFLHFIFFFLSNDFGTVWLHLIATLLCFHSPYARLTFPDPQCEVQRRSDGYSSFSGISNCCSSIVTKKINVFEKWANFQSLTYDTT